MTGILLSPEATLFSPTFLPPRTTQHSKRTGQALNTLHKDTTHAVSNAFVPNKELPSPAVPVGEAAQSYGTAAKMPLQIQLYHQLLTVFKGLAIQIQLSYFKKDSAHTENLAFKKVQELK